MPLNRELLCEPCKFRGITSTAVKYCKWCQEQLCKECENVHKSFKMTRSHVLVNTKDIPSLKLCLEIETRRMCTEHLNKTAEIYCSTHDELLCCLCLLQSDLHKNCIDTLFEINSVSKSLVDCKLADEVSKEVHSMASYANKAVTGLMENKDVIRQNLDDITTEVEILRNNLIKVFDCQTQAIVKKVDEVSKDIEDEYAKVIENFEKLIRKAEENEHIFENILQNGKPDDIFRCLVSVLQTIKELKLETEELSKGDYKQVTVVMKKTYLMEQLEANEKLLTEYQIKETKVKLFPSFPFEQTEEDAKSKFISWCSAQKGNRACGPNATRTDKSETDVSPSTSQQCPFMKKTTKTENAKSQSGKEDRAESYSSSNTLNTLGDDTDKLIYDSSDPLSVKAEYVNTKGHLNKWTDYDIEINHGCTFSVVTGNTNKPWISGIACLPNDRLVLSDFRNSSLILLDSDYKVLVTKSLDFEPGYLCLLNTTCLAVCLMKTNLLLLVDIKEEILSTKKYLRTRHHPKCVQAVEDKFLVSSFDAYGVWYLDLITVEGEICQQIKHKGLPDGHKIAIQILHEDKNNFRIVQCCEIEEILQCFIPGGSIVFEEYVSHGSSLAIDSTGHIFVVKYTGQIQVFSPNGDFRLSFRKKNKMYRAKLAAFNQSMDKLFVTTNKDNVINVLNVKRTKKRKKRKTQLYT